MLAHLLAVYSNSSSAVLDKGLGKGCFSVQTILELQNKELSKLDYDEVNACPESTLRLSWLQLRSGRSVSI